ncbi:signal peptidase I [Candidatus Dojkabacteria bacterium]|uniref:Signal peptidase I n=1 Tax=Candidatus Dojkabacteria bacterium TaxID=2099670 RepID=A0A955L8I5_9BACT|nr:signal peptidase I [Candidatus Dojkabacteria bacterium]
MSTLFSRDSILSFLKETAQTIITALILTGFIYYFIATPNQVQGSSMYPNVLPDELILTSRFKHHLSTSELGKRLGWDYHHGQIIIFEKPGKEAFIKRIIAIPGDTVLLEGNRIIINGETIHELYLSDDIKTSAGNFLREGIEVTVPEESYIVLGDNRTNSLDSRHQDVGFVHFEDIIGPAELRILPINRLGIIPIGETEPDEHEANPNIEVTLSD